MNLKEQIISGADKIEYAVNDCIDYGFDYENIFPASTYIEVEMNGKTYIMELEVRMIREKRE